MAASRSVRISLDASLEACFAAASGLWAALFALELEAPALGRILMASCNARYSTRSLGTQTTAC